MVNAIVELDLIERDSKRYWALLDENQEEVDRLNKGPFTYRDTQFFCMGFNEAVARSQDA